MLQLAFVKRKQIIMFFENERTVGSRTNVSNKLTANNAEIAAVNSDSSSRTYERNQNDCCCRRKAVPLAEMLSKKRESAIVTCPPDEKPDIIAAPPSKQTKGRE